MLGKMHDREDATKRWEEQMSILEMYHTFRELQGIDGEPIDFEWKNFPGAAALDLLLNIQKDLEGKRITPENFTDRIIFMSMFNDIYLDKKGYEDTCNTTSRKIKEYASRFNDGHWAFLGHGEESKWYQGCAINCGGKLDLRASQMVEDFENSRHPVFQGISPLGRGILKRENNRNTVDFNGEYDNIDLLYRTVHSANQLCIYGAVTKWCGKQSRADSGEAIESRPESARRTPREIQIKQEELKSSDDFPRLPPDSGNRVLQNLENVEPMPLMSKIESLRTTAQLYQPVEEGNYDRLLRWIGYFCFELNLWV